LGKASARLVKQVATRRGPSTVYLRSMLSGMRRSFGFEVDRDLRIYQAR
jgi:hypothetical protein